MELRELAADAYVYGFPLVFDVGQIDRFVREGVGDLPGAPFNTFAHGKHLATPKDEFVSVNNDTLYSIAQLDLSSGPVRLRVPDTGECYYVLQFVDAWSNNFAYVGKRATGTRAGEYLIVPPGWSGQADVPVIHAPTAVATIVGRIACDGPDDLPNVFALQSGFTLDGQPGNGIPDVKAPQDLLFLERLRRWMAAFPPAPADQDYAARFAPLGLLDGRPYTSADPEILAGLADGRERIEQTMKAGHQAPVNGWDVNPHAFDYNLDFFELGTLDEAAWRLPDREQSYLVRAVSARAALWGNHGYEAVYPTVRVDSDGRQLNGAHSYTLRFEELPPVGAFWSITMYAAPDYYLVDNPIGRYSIGDRTPGIQHAGDGSLTIVMSHEEPADTANWLPAPAGDFRPMMRLYMPGQAVLDGSYRLPPVVRE
ncbi:DUF1254 domain-containing protein [Nonomuraea sp. NPDC050328]|uniref:DUF1254 domain-containing protein n=1 Tax=Nonomuraea sp. NPDC050328 TaxID=3364361 RepID=UPI0037BC80B1